LEVVWLQEVVCGLVHGAKLAPKCQHALTKERLG